MDLIAEVFVGFKPQGYEGIFASKCVIPIGMEYGILWALITN